ncbi:toll/interleukin-1 receptor domain-containing protein [Cellulophaga sp. Z1A5H]|uniref:toll/interleukin-1 receptor domain-containing protein n=1 Tax=Cellulophaga sp. Z1A5H TaxID=2687291 RepID=UPI0013FDB696|nr:toll/interleukin-1 receptor domain-containing protein [Cellulophaga sp. Z1A5H]
MNTKSYLFELDYGKRMESKPFLIDLMSNFDNQSLTGITFLVNNNPYNFEFLLLLVFEKQDKEFDHWLNNSYPKMKYRFLYNYSTDDIVKKQLEERRYNAFSFSNELQMNEYLKEESTKIFLFPSKEVCTKKFGGKNYSSNSYKVFLSHSSKDKPIIEPVFTELQKSEIKVWYDKYEIEYGDSITEKINLGLNECGLGIICLSKNFMSSNWAKSEMNYFLQKRINSKTPNFICINIDLEHNELPPLIQDYRYIDFKNDNWISELVNIISKKAVHNNV